MWSHRPASVNSGLSQSLPLLKIKAFPLWSSRRFKTLSRSMSMKSQALGKNTSNIEVLNVSRQGLWLYVMGAEYFLPYSEYPWFKEATITQIHHVKLIRDYRLEWPALDVEIEIASLKSPAQYPLVYK